MQGTYRPVCPTCGTSLDLIVGHDATYRCTVCNWRYWVRIRSEGGKLAIETIEPEEEGHVE